MSYVIFTHDVCKNRNTVAFEMLDLVLSQKDDVSIILFK